MEKRIALKMLRFMFRASSIIQYNIPYMYDSRAQTAWREAELDRREEKIIKADFSKRNKSYVVVKKSKNEKLEPSCTSLLVICCFN